MAPGHSWRLLINRHIEHLRALWSVPEEGHVALALFLLVLLVVHLGNLSEDLLPLVVKIKFLLVHLLFLIVDRRAASALDEFIDLGLLQCFLCAFPRLVAEISAAETFLPRLENLLLQHCTLLQLPKNVNHVMHLLFELVIHAPLPREDVKLPDVMVRVLGHRPEFLVDVLTDVTHRILVDRGALRVQEHI